MLTKKLCHKFKNKEKTSLLGESHGRLVNQAKRVASFGSDKELSLSSPHLAMKKLKSQFNS